MNQNTIFKLLLNFTNTTIILFGKHVNQQSEKNNRFFIDDRMMSFYIFHTISNEISTFHNITWEYEEDIPIFNQTLKIIVSLILF